MNINRNTYEEYFMLYADKELSAEMRRAVEDFVEAHPDLKAELELYLSLKLSDDGSVRLADKSFLHKNENSYDGALETQMLMHLDKELPGDETAALEQLIASNDDLAQSWALLQKTKLSKDETVSFPDKKSLYRRHSAETPIIRLAWVRYAMAAAAALILFFGLTWVYQNQEKENNNQLIAQADEANGNKSSAVETVPGQDNEQQRADASEQKTSGEKADQQQPDFREILYASAENGKSNTVQGSIKYADQGKSSHKVVVSTAGQQIASSNNLITEGKPTIQREADIINAGEEPVQQVTALNEVPRVNVSPNTERPNADNSDQAIGSPEIKADYATQALARNDQYTEDLNDINQEKSRKGFRQLVRKANRIYNKVTNPDIEKPVVKVGNLEFAFGK